MEYFIDLFFLIDIFINFNTTFMHENGLYETSRCNIALSYLKGYFLIDFISSIPIDKVIIEFTYGGTYNKMLRIFKLPKLFSTLKMTKLFKLTEFFK